MLAGQKIMSKQEADFVMVNLKVPKKLREEFKVAAKLEGMDLSGMLRQFMIRTIRAAKEREPENFQALIDKTDWGIQQKNIPTDPRSYEDIPQTRLFSDGSGKPVTRKKLSGAIKQDIKEATEDAIERTKRKAPRR